MLAFSDISDETKKNEQVGFMEMPSAFAIGVRNSFAHTHGKLEEAQKAFEYLALASLFCRRIDDASPKLAAPPNPEVDIVLSGSLTLRDETAQRRSPLRWAS